MIKEKTIEIDNKYKEIAKLISKKKFSQARRLAEKLAGVDALFLTEVGVLFARLGQNLSAKHMFKRALEISPKNPSVHYNYGLYLKNQKLLKDAEKEFRLAIKYNDSEPSFYSMLGNTLLEQNKVNLAEDEYITALEIDKKNLFALTGLANIAMVRGEFNEAEIIYKKLIKLNKKYPVPYVSLVLLYKQQGRDKDLRKIQKLAEKMKYKIALQNQDSNGS